MVKEKKSKTKEIVSDDQGAGWVISRLNHTVTVSYDGKGMCIPPRGRVKVANKQLLGALPSGVYKQ